MLGGYAAADTNAFIESYVYLVLYLRSTVREAA